MNWSEDSLRLSFFASHRLIKRVKGKKVIPEDRRDNRRKEERAEGSKEREGIKVVLTCQLQCILGKCR